MDKPILESFLHSPILWGVFAVVALAVAVSGKFDMTAAKSLLVLAGVLSAIGVYRSPIVLNLSWVPRFFSMVIFCGVAGLSLHYLSEWLRSPSTFSPSTTAHVPDASPAAPVRHEPEVKAAAPAALPIKNPKRPSLRFAGANLHPLVVGERVRISIQIRNDTNAPVYVRNHYQITLIDKIPDTVEKRREMENWLWNERGKTRQSMTPDPLRIPVQVGGMAFFLENDEGPPVPEGYLEKLRSGGGVYVLGTLEVEGEDLIPYCGFAKQPGIALVMCLEHNQ